MPVHWFDEDRCREDGDLNLARRRADAGWKTLFNFTVPAPDDGLLPVGSTGPSARILLAEDDDDMRGLLAQTLAGEGYGVTECSDGVQLLDHLSGILHDGPLEHFDVIVSDIRMPGLTGLEILEGLQEGGGLPPTILITAFGDEATHAAAELAGAVVTLDKPFEVEELLATVRRVLEQGGRA
jgi:DNA-binding response OmpR family regulator